MSRITCAALIGLAALLVGATSLAARGGPDDAAALAARRQEMRAYALTHEGDARKGACVVCRLSCRSCHVIQKRGGAVGPALDKVGGRLTREQLVDQLLEPSRRGRSVRIEFADGRSKVFVLLEEGTDVLKVRDRDTGEVATHRKGDLEGFAVAGSDMPDGLVDRLTRDELADLIAFLVSLK